MCDANFEQSFKITLKGRYYVSMYSTLSKSRSDLDSSIVCNFVQDLYGIYELFMRQY